MRTLTLAFMLIASVASAQPQSQPMVQASDLTYLGSVTFPSTDGSGTSGESDSLTYGGNGLGIGPNGSLYYGCFDQADLIARVSIPAIGATGTVLDRCTAVPNLNAVDGTDGGQRALGGTLWWNNRLILSGYAYYDADYDGAASHFSGASVATLSGPVSFSSAPAGVVGGSMVSVPLEWRALVGGPALTGLWGVTNIERSSYGPAMVAFNPDDVGVTSPVPSTTLVRYTMASPFKPLDWRAVGGGSLAWPSGFRSVLAVQRVGSGTPCYGVGGANGPCPDPTSDVNAFHAYPYVIRVYVYDANHLASVKAGDSLPGSVQPVASFDLPEVTAVAGAATFRAAAYDDTTRRWYVVTQAGGTQPRVHVYALRQPVPPPPPSIPDVLVPCEIVTDPVTEGSAAFALVRCAGAVPKGTTFTVTIPRP